MRTSRVPCPRASGLVLLVGIIALASAADGGPTQLNPSVKFDGLLWTTAHYWQTVFEGVSSAEIGADPIVALAGVTAGFGSVASARLYWDVGGSWGRVAQDAYLDFEWSSGFGFRAGQFLLPLGVYSSTDLDHQRTVNIPAVAWYLTPSGTRDIGVMGRWEGRQVSVSAAVVNGAGIMTMDNNRSKDICGRIMLRPFQSMDGQLALRGYFGRPDASSNVWRTLAAEATFNSGSLSIESELQDQVFGSARVDAAYLQGAHAVGRLEPCLRIDAVVRQGEKPEFVITAGVNYEIVPGHARLLTDCFFQRNTQVSWQRSGFLVRLQARI